MTLKELRAKKEKELFGMIEKLRMEFATLSLKGRMGQLKDTSALMKNKREVARILTIQKERASQKV
ncbi:MAG: 50S ribosomal protein L29 [bacterium]|nr:50S ribosomal protein L29 [bacterium]